MNQMSDGPRWPSRFRHARACQSGELLPLKLGTALSFAIAATLLVGTTLVSLRVGLQRVSALDG